MTTRILVIKDQEDNRRILRDLLRSASYEMIEAVQSTMRALVAKQAIAFRVESDHRMGHSPWMQHGSKQIFLNLVGNAVKFTPNGGHVTLSAPLEDQWSNESVDPPNQCTSSPDHRSDGWVEIAVADTGRGIPAEEPERIFLEFRQVQTARMAGNPEGTGLGLALAKRFVEMHGPEPSGHRT